MSAIIGRLSLILKQASDDFYFDDYHKSGCWTRFCCSPRLNQVIVIKFPTREHYITDKLVKQYLQNTRKFLEKKLGTAFLKEAYVLNILVSNKISKSCCLEMADIDYKTRNMDMVFNPKIVTEKKIVNTICRGLATKTEAWCDKIKKTCKKRGIKPYGSQLEKIKYLNNAHSLFWRYAH